MKVFLLTNYILTIFALSSNLYSQVTQEWVARYNNQGNDGDIHQAFSLAVDGSGNVYVTGRSFGSDTIYDYATIKYNSAGVEQWVQRYNGNGNGNDEASSIAVDGLGNVYVTGGSWGSGTDDDYATIKYNSAGVEQWVQRYNGPGNILDWATSLVLDGSGNIYVTGFSNGIGTINDCATVKYNSYGVEQWVQRYNSPINGGDWANALAVDDSGNVYVTGSSWGIWDDYITIKYNSAGAQQWVQRYNGPGNEVDIAYSIAVDGSGNVYVTGGSWGGYVTGHDYATIKYNSAGEEIWVHRFHHSGSEFAYSLALDNSGNVYVTGQNYLTLKYKPNGELQWISIYISPPVHGYNTAFSIAVDSSGNVYVTGGSDGIGTNVDYATVKYNTYGVQQWVQRYNLPGLGIDVGRAIKVDGNGNVYVTGYSQGLRGFDYATIKYSQPIGITPISSEIPAEYLLQQNYPNPFNPVTNIKFSVPKTGFVKLTVYDAAGREAEVLFNGELAAGSYNYDFDASQLASGIYFYKLESNDFTQTKKMVLVK